MATKNTASVGGLFSINFNTDDAMADIESRLGSMNRKAPSVLKGALNKAARAARTENAKQARKRYKYDPAITKKKISAKDLMDAKWATNGNLQATLTTSTKGMGEYYHFQVRPRALSWTKDKPDIYRARVLKASGMQAMYADQVENNTMPAADEAKGFITAFKSGHVALTYRERNVQAKNRKGPLNKHTQAITPSFAPNWKWMSQRSFAEPPVEEKLYSALQAEMDKRIDAVLAKGG